MLLVRHREQGVEAPQDAIAAPFFRELDGGAREIRGKALEFLLELVEERERVGRCAGETAQDLAAAKHAHLLGVCLHHRVADSDLSVSTERDGAVASCGEDRCRSDGRKRHSTRC